LFYGLSKNIKSKEHSNHGKKQNCYNAEKVLRFVAPSGEQALTKSYKVKTISVICLFM